MGAGILPTTIIKGKVYLLFGKENQYEDSAPGYSDFGGGVDGKETMLQAAIREGGEELTGFLGTDAEVKRMVKRTYNIDSADKKYRTHIFRMEYDPMLEKYYNNNQRFIQQRLDKEIIKKVKIFEKAEIHWFCIDDLPKHRPKFRHFYREVVDKIYAERREISTFIKHTKTKKSRDNI
jgi:8-oxo-dGTP pyrophosphatase MutT (NUDIX family)